MVIYLTISSMKIYVAKYTLGAHQFYGRHHRQLFMLMQQLVTEGHPVDYLTLSARLKHMETIGSTYLTELMMFANAEKFDDYAQLLREIWHERQKHYSRLKMRNPKQYLSISYFLRFFSPTY